MMFLQERAGEALGCSPYLKPVCCLVGTNVVTWPGAQFCWGNWQCWFCVKKTPFPFAGSGIYAPDSPKVFHYDMKTNEGKLLLSELYSHPRKSPAYPAAVDWSAYATTIKPFPVQKNTFRGFMSRDEFNFTELFENAGNLSVCHKDLCCHLSYRMLRQEGNEVYVLGAFTGLHGRRRREYWQVISARGKGSA